MGSVHGGGSNMGSAYSSGNRERIMSLRHLHSHLTRLVFADRLWCGVILVGLACQPADSAVDSARTTAATVSPASVAAPSALDSARAAVARRYAEHFAAGQGFTREMVHARQAWFTPTLAALLVDDVDASTTGIGHLDGDPFVDGQQVAARYTIGAARWAHDTALVDVTVQYPPDVGNGQETREVTVALKRAAPREWQIADLIFTHGRLADGLRAAAARRP